MSSGRGERCWESLAGGRLRVWRLTLDEDAWKPAERAGRWSRRPGAMIYASTTAALATLEARAHLDPPDVRRVHQLVHLEVDVRAGDVECLRVDRLPADWKRRKAITRALGERWLQQGRSLALLVPSALVGGELNVLIDPSHPKWPRWRAAARSSDFRFDHRLVGPGEK
jgi:RES domain-containing protein